MFGRIPPLRVFFILILLGTLTPVLAQEVQKDAAKIETTDAPPPAPAATPFSDQDVLTYMEQIIAWQKDASGAQSMDGNAREILLADALHQNSAQALRAAFDFARAQAPLFDKPVTTEKKDTEPDDKKMAPANLQAFSLSVEQHIAELQSQLNLIERRIRIAPPHARPAWRAQREKVAGALNLAKAQQDLIKTIEQTVDTNNEAETGTFLKKISNLARSAPGIATPDNATMTPDSIKPAADTKNAADAPGMEQKTNTTVNKGLLQLGADLFTILRKKADVQAMRQQGKELRTTTRDMRARLRDALRAIGLQGNSLNQGVSGDVKTIEQQSAELETLTNRFKILSGSVVPLSQAELWIDGSCRTLKEWVILLDDNLAAALRKFMLHLIVLGITLLIPLVLSEIARRTIMRYVHDRRRQQQLRILRRSLLVAAVALIITLNLTSEIGSLATFAGFLTAGLAVALQNVILSTVAHFFFFGRYGVRAGDRVTVGGVTGDVTQIGMVRLYLAEVSGDGEDATPTGRIVAFPNSILFQPTAFYKHMR